MVNSSFIFFPIHISFKGFNSLRIIGHAITNPEAYLMILKDEGAPLTFLL